MAIWQLDPINPGAPDWRASPHVKRVIIRAPNEINARDIAYKNFGTAVTKEFIGENLPRPPWRNESKVKCQQLTNSEWEESGADEILDPPGYHE